MKFLRRFTGWSVSNMRFFSMCFYRIRSGILIRNRSRCGIEPSSYGINLSALRWRLQFFFIFLEFLSDELWPCFHHRECHFLNHFSTPLVRHVIQSEKNINSLKKNRRRKGALGWRRIFLQIFKKRIYYIILL